ncbi:MAG: AAA family ATPase [Thermoleophilia bacterium]
MAREGAGRGHHHAHTASLQQAIDTHAHALTDEQQRLAETVARGVDRVGVVIGAAGAGKTTAIQAATRALQHDGIPVTGLAPSANAAHQLQHHAGIPADTLHAALANPDRHIPTDGVLVIDEASMADTRTLTSILTHARERDTRVVMVGDPLQLPAVGPGGLFAAIAAERDAVSLEANNRQTNTWERDALRDLRHGRTLQALTAYATHGRIHIQDTIPELHQRIGEDWWHTHQAHPDQTVVMLAHTNHDIRELNQQARAHMHAHGRLGPDTPIGGLRLAVGDAVVLKRNDREHGLRNGTRATITHITHEAITARAVDDGTLHIPRGYAERHLQHGYAITIHAAQGLTTDHTLILTPDAPALRELGYVALTRHKHTTRLYLTPDHPDTPTGPNVTRVIRHLDVPASQPLASRQ